MASKSTNHPFDPFKDKRTNFDAISTEVDSKNTMKEIEQVIEEKRKDIFDILSTSRADGNTDKDEKSLKKMKDALDKKKTALEDKLGEVSADFNISSDNSDLINYCKNILNKAVKTNEDKALGDKCGQLLEDLQNVYTKGRKEKLFSGKKDPADGTFEDLTDPDCFNNIFNSKNSTELQKNIDEFVNKVYNSKDNGFSISKSKLYGKKQAEVAARTAIFLHCIQRALNEGKISDTKKIKSILKNLENQQIPKIRSIYNLKKEKEAVDAEYETLIDIRKNDTADIDWTDTTTDINLTDSFESKSTGKAKKIDFYNFNKDNIKITIGTTTYSASDIVLKDVSGEKSEFNTQANFSSGDYTLCLKISGNDVEIGKLCIDYSDPTKASFVLKQNPNIASDLSAKGVTGDVNVEIPIMAVKNVATPRTRTGQVSLTRSIKAKIKGSVVPVITLEAQRERQTTITNVDQVNRAIAQREADEELRERYKNAGWNIFDRANLFLRRKFIKDRIVNKKMGGKSGLDWSESGQSAAHRHQIEKQENLADNLNSLVDIDDKNYPDTRSKLDTLIDDFTGKNLTPPWTGGMSESNFQIQFADILNRSGIDFDKTKPTSATIASWKPVSEIIKSNNIKSLSTNILMQAKQFKAHQFMVSSIRDHIAANPAEGDDAFNTRCRGEIGKYIDTYDDIPDFLSQMKLSIDNADDIKTLKGNDAALATIQAQSLKYRLQILDGGGEAYNVQKKGGTLTKIGRFLDNPMDSEKLKNTKFAKWLNEHPGTKEALGWIRGGAKVGAMVAPGLLLAPLGPLAVASGVGGMSAITTLFKKKSHYEKENRSYQRMQATNLTDYRNKRTNLANEVAGMKWYEGRFWGDKKKIRDQYNDYILTTQDQLELTNSLLTNIKTYLKKGDVLNSTEKDDLGKLLADGLARLDYHKKTGQNFLGSDDPALAEKEYKQLQNAIIGGTLRLKIDTNDLRSNYPYTAYYNATKNVIENGTGDEYNTQGYLKARKRFKNRSNFNAGRGALKAGAISFGLSYLASSIASGNKTTTTETSNNMHNGQVGGEYNLGDAQEHLFVSGDVNPTMNSVITPDTQNITGATIYSSVDSVPCSVAKGTNELALANSDLASTFSSSPFSGNTAWIDAKTNFINEARTNIWSIPGVSEGNRQLALARAIEGRNEGILKPAIAAQAGKPASASLIGIDPSAIHWIDGGMQGTSTGAIGQSFRNMGLVGLDYVQKGTETVVEHVSRAIPIPVGLNTFGAPKSDPAA